MALLMLSTSELQIKMTIKRGAYVMFETEYLCIVWVKKDEVNANLIQYDCPN